MTNTEAWPDTEHCPQCRRDLADPRNPRFSRVMGIVVQGDYDGVLYWQCPYCAHMWNRWPRKHYLWARAQRAIGAATYSRQEAEA